MITASTLRNIIAILRNIDRDQIEAEIGRMPDAGWESFRDDPYRHLLRMNDHGQAGVARIVSERMRPSEEMSPLFKQVAAIVEADRARYDFHGETPALQVKGDVA